ncbi:MAG: class I SAM-dependent methyltransferase [Calditrichaeota bacterium]|nr:class I SAM-dependent methyltransferase [Calditrichota bacterium]
MQLWRSKGEAVEAGNPAPPGLEQPPYTALAALYDDLMAHVDYSRWSRFALDLLTTHGLAPPDADPPPILLDCGCGTGTTALLLALYGYRVEAFDRSPGMIERARAKSVGMQNAPQFSVGTFESLDTRNHYDSLLCLYDSINYLLTEDAFSNFIAAAANALRPGGLFLFDICTESNSRIHFTDRSERGRSSDLSYIRWMHYDAKQRLQENIFEITLPGGGEPLLERHIQRIYPVGTVRALLGRSPLTIVEETDEFRRRPPSSGSLRVHFLCRKVA